jgi:DNA polymerase III epsilon subunit-like protein
LEKIYTNFNFVFDKNRYVDWYDTGKIRHNTMSTFTPEREVSDDIKRIIFIDLETSGLPEKDEEKPWKTPHYRELTKYNNCRIIQMCVMLCDANDLTPLETKCSLIKANDFHISAESFNVHGISRERTLEEGRDISQFLQQDIFPLFLKANYIAAHNAVFDINVLKSELVRGNFVDVLNHMEKNIKVICTMRTTKHIVGAKNLKGKIKNPSLKELYHFATDRILEDHHDAMYDVINMHEAVKIVVERDGLQLYNENQKSSKKDKGTKKRTTLKEEVNLLRNEIEMLKTEIQDFKSVVMAPLSEIIVKLDHCNSKIT